MDAHGFEFLAKFALCPIENLLIASRRRIEHDSNRVHLIGTRLDDALQSLHEAGWSSQILCRDLSQLPPTPAAENAERDA